MLWMPLMPAILGYLEQQNFWQGIRMDKDDPYSNFVHEIERLRREWQRDLETHRAMEAMRHSEDRMRMLDAGLSNIRADPKRQDHVNWPNHYTWHHASAPPTGGARRVLVWHKQGGFGGFWYTPGHWSDAVWPRGTVTHWMDVEPPNVPGVAG